MRIDVKKFLFIGTERDRLQFFEKAQNAGIIDFIKSKAIKGKDVPLEIQNNVTAIKILRGLPTAPQEELADFVLADGLVHKILHLKNTLERLEEEQRVIKLEISRVAIFGNFSLDDLHFIEQQGHRKIQFFFSKKSASTESFPPELIYVGSDHGMDYFVAINAQPTQYPKLIEMRIEKPVGVLQERDRAIEKEIRDTEHRLKNYAKYNTFLHHALVYKLNTYHLEAAQGQTRGTLDDQLFVIAGWVPVNKISKLKQLVSDMHVFAEEIAIEPTDVIPTYLENKGMHRLGEDLVHIYDTPSPTDNDPSIWVLFSFALFFSFIVGDGGYGLIFLAAALFIRYKNPLLKGTGKRVLNLATLLCVACIFWGLLTSTFFGISLSPTNPLRQFSLIGWLVEKKAAYHIAHHDSTYDYWVAKFPNLANIQNPAEFVQSAVTVTDGHTNYVLLSKFSDNIMMELALLIGMVHVILSMARYLNRNWINIGWIAFIIGCYLYFPSYLDTPTLTQYLFDVPLKSAAVGGLYLIWGGIAIASILSIIKHRIAGLLEIMTAIQVFADIMSYLRLYALGLAGSIVSATINESLGSVNFVVAAILIVAGHGVNMALAIMGGIIHGLRLNFLEWYHYSFEGGGKMFKPLYKMKVE